MGLPIVASRVPGCIDAILDGVTGTLVAARDDVALAGALRTYLNDAALRARHGAAARERVLRDFQQERIWSELHKEYVGLSLRAGRNVARASDATVATQPASRGLTRPEHRTSASRAV
jgi:hypothetical protein